MTYRLVSSIYRYARDSNGLSLTDRQKIIKAYRKKTPAKKRLSSDELQQVLDIFQDLVVTKDEHQKLLQIIKLSDKNQKRFNSIVGSDGKRILRKHLSNLATRARKTRNKTKRSSVYSEIAKHAGDAKHLIRVLKKSLKQERNKDVVRQIKEAYLQIIGEAVLNEFEIFPEIVKKIPKKLLSDAVNKIFDLARSKKADLAKFFIYLPSIVTKDHRLMFSFIKREPKYLPFIAPQLVVLPKELAQTAYKLNITLPKRFPNEDSLRTIINTRLLASYSDVYDPRHVAVVVLTKEDWNKSFQKSSKIIDLTKGYRVFYYEVNNEGGWRDAVLDATAGRLGSLGIVGGHGDGKALSLGAPDPQMSKRGKEIYYLASNDRRDLKGIDKRFVKGAHFILDSCKAGKGGFKARSPFTLFAHSFPSAYVHAMDRDGTLGLNLSDEGLFAGTTNGLSNIRSVVMRKEPRMYITYYPHRDAKVFPHPQIQSKADPKLKLTKLNEALKDKRPEVRAAAKYELEKMTNGKTETDWRSKVKKTGVITDQMVKDILDSHSSIDEKLSFVPNKESIKVLSEVVWLFSSALKNGHTGTKIRTLRIIAEMGAAAKELLPGVIAALDSKVLNVRIAALNALVAMGDHAEPAIPKLVKLLKDKKYGIVYLALRVLGSIGPGARQVVPEMMAVAKRKYKPVIRMNAIKNMGRIGSLPKSIIQELIGILRSQDTDLYAVACEALGVNGVAASNAVPVIADIVRNSTSSYIRSIAMIALGRIGPSAKSALPLLMREEKMANFATVSIAMMGRSVIPYLTQSMVDGKPYVSRLLALRFLGDDAIGPLIKALEDSRSSMRASVTLGFFGRKAVKPLVKKLVQTNNVNLSSQILPTLDRYGNEAVSELMSYFNSPYSGRAVAFLYYFGAAAKKAIPALVKLLRKSPADIGITLAFKSIGQDAVPSLLPVLKDPSDGIRVGAVRVLSMIKPISKSTLKALIPLLVSKDLEIKTTVVYIIQEFGPGATPILKEVLKNAKGKLREILEHYIKTSSIILTS